MNHSDLIFAMLEFNITIEVYEKIVYVRRGKVELSTQTMNHKDVLALVDQLIGYAEIENYLEKTA